MECVPFFVWAEWGPIPAVVVAKSQDMPDALFMGGGDERSLSVSVYCFIFRTVHHRPITGTPNPAGGYPYFCTTGMYEVRMRSVKSGSLTLRSCKKRKNTLTVQQQ